MSILYRVDVIRLLVVYYVLLCGYPPLALADGFTLQENLIPNPQLQNEEGQGEGGGENGVGSPLDWFRPPPSLIQDSTFLYGTYGSDDIYAIGLTAGHDRSAQWSTRLQSCEPGERYQFSGDFYRQDRSDPRAYAEVSIWGKEYRLNTHRVIDAWQKLQAQVVCPEDIAEKDDIFLFKNDYPGTTFWMRSPQLVRDTRPQLEFQRETLQTDFFPLGVYGANVKNVKEIKELGLNTAVMAMTRENIDICLELGMRCTLSVPRDAGKLAIALEKFSSTLGLGNFSYYVNDEPGIHSFSESTAKEIYDTVKAHFPNAVTNMAIVRPQAIPYYEQAADFFMLDQYPVPHMPMSWLSESMDEAAGYVGKDRLQSVIQAFGGGKFENSGWPRLPTFEEMNCLSFLSVVHGSRGIYYYTFPSITSTDQGKEDFSRLIRRLNSIRSWLQVVNDDEPVKLKMISKYSVDPSGNKAVHCARKEQYNTGMLICVNTIRTYTEAHIEVPSEGPIDWQDYYTGGVYPVVDSTIQARFAPLEVKVLLESK
ncbi:hypothetical protein [Desulforhopalus sp. 52FAK]